MSGANWLSNLVSTATSTLQALAVTEESSPLPAPTVNQCLPQDGELREKLLKPLQADFHLLKFHALKPIDPDAKIPNKIPLIEAYAQKLHQRLDDIEKHRPDFISTDTWRLQVDLTLAEAYGSAKDFLKAKTLLRKIIALGEEDGGKAKHDPKLKSFLQRARYNLAVVSYNEDLGIQGGHDSAQSRGDHQVDELCHFYSREEACASALALSIDAKVGRRNDVFQHEIEDAVAKTKRLLYDFPDSPYTELIRRRFLSGKKQPESGDWYAAYKAVIAATAGTTERDVPSPVLDAVKGAAYGLTVG